MKRLEIQNPWPGAAVYFKRQTTSTMEDARRLFLGGCPGGTVVMAGFQERGRGRVAERLWSAEPGKNLLFTLVLRSGGGSKTIGGAPQRLPLIAGLALALSMERKFGLSVQLKWPNDLLVGGRKLAGILCEALAEGEGPAEAGGLGVLVGVGLNCNQVIFPGALQPTATSLARILGREVSVTGVLAEVLPALKAGLEDPHWQAKVSARLYGLNREVYLDVAAGVRSCGQRPSGVRRGIIRGLNHDGALLFEPQEDTDSVSEAAEPIAVYAGEIRIAPRGDP